MERARPAWLVARGRSASPQAATARSVWGSRVAPTAPGRDRGVEVWLVELADLPDEVPEFARERDRDHVAGLAAVDAQPEPLAVQPLLAAPADLARARVLAALAPRKGVGDGWLVAVVVCCFDQQPAGVWRAGFGDRPALGALAGGVLAGRDPQVCGQRGGCSKRRKSPTSQQYAVTVSIPRRQRSF